MIPRTTLRAALSDPQLLGEAIAGESWRAWRTLLIAAMGEALDDAERALFRELTGREHEPGARVEEFVAVVGRRGGKSRAVSVLATYIAGLCEPPSLVRGERGVLLLIAPDQRQALICLEYIEAAFEGSPILRQLIEARTASALRLTNRINIEVRASDFRNLRGPTYVAVIADESAFWLNENSSNPDSEILAAVRPGLATTGGPLFMISSPYARRGELWRTYKKHFGADGDPLILVAQAASRVMNATLPESVIDRATERDPAAAAAEYGGEFRRDLEAFASIEAIEACVEEGCRERGPLRQYSYVGFVDPSGGSSDAMTLCLAHFERASSCVVVDLLREARPPFSPEAVVREFVTALKQYRVHRVTGDRYGGEWPREVFQKLAVRYEPAAKPKSELYVDLLPLINSGRVVLPDHPRLVSQLAGLERRVARSGKDSIDHGPGAHDDIASLCADSASTYRDYKSWVFGSPNDPDPDGSGAWKHAQFWGHITRSAGRYPGW